MSERGRFQNGIDAVAEGYRAHKGTFASGAVLAAGSGAAVERIDGASIAIGIGVVSLIFSSGVDYMNNVATRYLPKREIASEKPSTVVFEDVAEK